MSTLTIGLFGFGVVGEGIYQVLSTKPGLQAVIKGVVIKHPHKTRNAPQHLFSTDADDILNDPEINLVIELIDDAEAAYHIVKKAFSKGKSVISANKKMIAEHLTELILLANKYKVSFLYEAAACGSIPVIRNLEEYFDNDLITGVTGIINGSTNYILTKMAKKNLSYQEALKEAQTNGFVESDPSLDVLGLDARNKLKILTLHAFGMVISEDKIITKGIQSLTEGDLVFAKEKNLVIKLIATSKVNALGELEEVSVLPAFLPRFHPLRLTDNEFNGVLIGGQLSDEQFFYGKGAGRYPTSSAVLSDISAIRYGYKYEYKKGIKQTDKVLPSKTRVFVSLSRDLPELDLSVFGAVVETYKNSHYSYTVLETTLQEIKPLFDLHGVSVIRYLD